MHVLPVMPRILEISAVVVGSNTSMDAVNKGFRQVRGINGSSAMQINQ